MFLMSEAPLYEAWFIQAISVSLLRHRVPAKREQLEKVSRPLT